eukprot:9840077-Alexandrium_andersonii.AAC.1
MSASLVGSEMCIRDSLATLRRAPASCGPSPPLPQEGHAAAGAVHHDAAVSYTHLTLPTICSV